MVEAAWTAPSGAQPPYLNMKRDGSIVRVTIRQQSINGGLTPGPTASIEVPLRDFEAVLLDAMGLTDG